MTAAGVVGLPSLVVETAAVLVTVPLFGQFPGVSLVVGLVTWTEVVAPAVRSAGPKPSTPAVMAQPRSELAMVQLRPALVGRWSEAVTPWAVPVPPLWTVTV